MIKQLVVIAVVAAFGISANGVEAAKPADSGVTAVGGNNGNGNGQGSDGIKGNGKGNNGNGNGNGGPATPSKPKPNKKG